MTKGIANLRSRAAIVGCLVVMGMAVGLSGCKKECNLAELEGYEIVEHFDKKGKFSHCEYVKIQEPDNSCPFGCDNHTKDKCDEYFHGTDTSIHLSGDYTAVLHKCDKFADTSKVKQPDACPTGCVNHTKSKCSLYVHQEQVFKLANGKSINLYPCDEWRDTLRVTADTVRIDILNISDLQANLARMEAIYQVDHNIAKVIIFNPLRVDEGGFPVITDFNGRVTRANGKIIAEWRDNFICPPKNGIMLTYKQWEDMGKPKLGVNPDNGAMYNISNLEKDKFPDLTVLNIVILPLEIEINSSATLASANNKIQQNLQMPISERPKAFVTFTGNFELNNGVDIPNLETLMDHFRSTAATLKAGPGQMGPATDSIAVLDGALIGSAGGLFYPTVSGKYFYIHGGNLSNIPQHLNVRAGSINSGDLGIYSNVFPSEIKINSIFNVQQLAPLHGQWFIPIKLTPTSNPSLPGGEWHVVGVNDWFLNNYNQGQNSAFYSDVVIVLGHYTNQFNNVHNTEGLDIDALNVDTLNNNFRLLKASEGKVNDPTLRIVPASFKNRQLNIGNVPSGSKAADGRTYIHRALIESLMALINVRPSPLGPPIPLNYCLDARNMILCYPSKDNALIQYVGEATYINMNGIGPGTNIGVLDSASMPNGKSVYTTPPQSSPAPNQVKSSAPPQNSGVHQTKSKKVVWHGTVPKNAWRHGGKR